MPLDAYGQPRFGDWLQTHSGGQFWPLDPHPDDFDIRDIAHGLSQICRFAGQCDTFYSVAQHSVILSEHVLPEHSMEALLHDATEAYMGDMPGPLKRLIPEVSRIESRIYESLAQAFGLPPELSEETRVADLRLLADEKANFMASAPAPWGLPHLPFGIRIKPWTPAEAKFKFLARFEYLRREG